MRACIHLESIHSLMVKYIHSSGATLPTAKFQSAINLPFHLGQIVCPSVPICKIRMVLVPASLDCCEDLLSLRLMGHLEHCLTNIFIISNKAYLFFKILVFELLVFYWPSSCSFSFSTSHFFPCTFLSVWCSGLCTRSSFFFFPFIFLLLNMPSLDEQKHFHCFNYYIHSNDFFFHSNDS